MTQRWYPPRAREWGMVCSQCRAMCWYKFSGAQQDGARAVGGHVSSTSKYYCPECAEQNCDAKLPRAHVEFYQESCWAAPRQLWRYAGLAEEPAPTCTLLEEKVKEELVPEATSEFALSLWAVLYHVRDAPKPPGSSAATWAFADASSSSTSWGGSPSTASAVAVAGGPPATAGNPDRDRVGFLLREIRQLDNQLLSLSRHAATLAERLQAHREELETLLGGLLSRTL